MSVMDVDEEISSAVAAILAARYQPKVGDRVRVRLSGECQVGQDDPVPWVHGWDGCSGTVAMRFSETFNEAPLDRHDIFVTFTEDADGRIAGSWFAHTELELIATPAPSPLTTEDAS